MQAHQRFELENKSLHLNSSNFSLEGNYKTEGLDKLMESLKITYSYSK